jgi:hypothetical protein
MKPFPAQERRSFPQTGGRVRVRVPFHGKWELGKTIAALKVLTATFIVALAGVGGLSLVMPDAVTQLRRTFYVTTGITFRSLHNAEAACGAGYALRNRKDPSHPTFKCFNKQSQPGPRTAR